MIINRIGDSPAEFIIDDDSKLKIEDVAAKYGHTNDCITIRTDDGVLMAYAVWKQGYNKYSFCRKPCANEPCDWDVLK